MHPCARACSHYGYANFVAEQAGVGNRAIALKNCRNVLLRDFSVLHGGHFALLATGVDTLTLDNLLVDTERDGFDIDCCHNVRVSNCTVNSPSDDAICPKSSYALGYTRTTGNVTIANCFVTGAYELGSLIDGTWKKSARGHGNGRIKCGTESNGGFRNIAISNCVLEGSKGIAIETADGALVEDIAISNITLRDTDDAPIFLRLSRRNRGPADTMRPGSLRRVLISNVVSYNSSSVAASILSGIPSNLIEDVKIDNCYFANAGLPTTLGSGSSAKPFPDWHTIQVPESEDGYPDPNRFGPTPAKGFFIRHLKNLEMSHVEIASSAPDPRPAFWLEDVHRADFFAINAPSQSNFALRNGSDLRILWSRGQGHHARAGSQSNHLDRSGGFHESSRSHTASERSWDRSGRCRAGCRSQGKDQSFTRSATRLRRKGRRHHAGLAAAGGNQMRGWWIAVVWTAGMTVGQAQVVTAQADNMRGSAYLHETVLKPGNVNAAHFGKQFSLTVDGDVFAEPLVVPALTIAGVRRDVVFAATEHDSVYAFDVNGVRDAPLWKTSFLDPTYGVTTLTEQDVECPFITPEVGITPTPVIDRASGTMYVLARTKERGAFVQKLHALDVTNGKERAGSPVTIAAAVAGKGDGAQGGMVRFDPLRENPRAALLLVDGVVVMTWASSCDVGPYHGWVMAYDARTLEQRAVLNTSPDGSDGGIWQSDAGAAADEGGNIFVATGNGDFNAASGGRDYGDTVLKLGLEGKKFVVRDYFTPFNQKQLDAKDGDLGSQGPVLLPVQTGARRHMMVLAGKEGKLYVLDRDRLGKFEEGADRQIVQSIKAKDAYGAAAYWNGHVYFTDRMDTTRDYALEGGQLVLKGTTGKMERPAATPVVSADGKKDAVLWVVETKEWDEVHNDRPAVLHAFDATDVAKERFNSEQNSGRDRAGMTVRFAIPTVVGGKVFVGTRGRVDVYGLLMK